ncbi:mechanosensitive ion channel domain-containing protein [Trichoderma breve]|uniref:Mechanosensitive ion channel protein n=1 Tax=Trichoderma breve TaxID=2034170 RepID=A0A9W9B6R3_9HYPO|nr:mechanosensitive ion channel domain-containing protein [Trichoderma breve]KAJ4857530.1 mechanosensitive ion channel domain-containing protein [Trichoderma breve]
MAQRQASRASRSSAGFIPLDGGDLRDMDNGGIPLNPLTTVKSNASTTGARKPTMQATRSHDEHNEKHGMHHRHAGRRRKMDDESLKRRQTGDEAKLNAMGRLYAKIVGFSVITRYMVYVVPVGILLAVPLIVLPLTGHKNDIYLGSHDKSRGPPLFKLFLWIQISWLSLWGVKAAAWFLPHAFMFFCGIVSAGTRKYATVLSNLTIVISIFFWGLASWLTFKSIFAQAFSDGITWVVNLERVLGACFVSSAILLGEKAIVQLIGVSYHQRSFDNRIKDSKREIHLLGLLYDASRTLFPMYCHEFAEEDYIIEDSIEMMLRRKAGKSAAPGAVAPMRIIGDVGRFGDKVTSVFGNLASEITGKHVFNPNSAHSIVIEALEKKRSSEALARRLWMSFVIEGRDALFPDDVEEVLGPAYKAEAEEAFEAIDTDANGDISLEEMVRKVVEMGKERKAIAEGMKDIGQALTAFDKVLLFVVLLISVFIFLSFFNSSLLTTIATAGTALLSLSFVFAVTTQEFLGSCIFLFVKHPYDVGDRIEISGTQMLVDRISLLYTVFTRTDKMQVSQVPNIVLNNLWIENVTRSKAMSETFSVDVSFDTSFEDIELLRNEMEKFVRSPENSRDFQPDFGIGIGGVNNLDKLTLKISIKHKSNWHNDRVRATRRSKFMCALAVAMKKIPILAPGGGGEALGGPTNPTYSVAVTDQWAADSRDKAAKATDAGRMVPSNAGQTPEEIQQSEKNAVAALNTNRSLVLETSGMWDADARSIASRDPSDEVSAGDLKKESSQRGGKRRAGEGLTGLTPIDSQHSTFPQSGTSPRIRTFDEEAQTGMPGSQFGAHQEDGIGRHSSYRGPSFDVSRTEDTLHLSPSLHVPNRGASVGRRQRGSSTSHDGHQ